MMAIICGKKSNQIILVISDVPFQIGFAHFPSQLNDFSLLKWPGYLDANFLLWRTRADSRAVRNGGHWYDAHF
jgi:hypothetical protein